MKSENTTTEDKKNVFALLLGMLIRPKTALEHLKDNHKRAWWLPAILIVGLTIAPLMARARTAPSMPAAPMPESVMQVEPGVMVEGIPDPGMMGAAPGYAIPTGPSIFEILGAVLGLPIAWLLWGGTLYLASVFLGRSSNFGQMFRLTVWTWLPYGIRSLIQTLYIAGTGETITNAGLSGFANQNQPAMIAPGPGQLALASILSKIDIYLIWHLFLASLGLTVFTNLKRRKAIVAVLVIWLILTLLGVVPAIFGGMVQGIVGDRSGGFVG